MNEQKCYPVLFNQKTRTNDFIVKIKSEKYCRTIKIGQYVDCRFNSPDPVVHPFIFSANKETGEFECYITAEMMTTLNSLSIPDKILLSNPQGDFFTIPKLSPKPVLIADESGLPAIFFLANEFMKNNQQPLVFLSAKSQFPFSLKPSQFVINGLPAGMLATCQLLEDSKIPARLLIEQGEQFIPGCFDGNFDDFFSELSGEEWHIKHVAVFVAGRVQLHEFVKKKWHHSQAILIK